MTTVAQMIEYLKTLPQDAEVWCGGEDPYDCHIVYGPVDIKSCTVGRMGFSSLVVFIDRADEHVEAMGKSSRG